MTDLLNVEVRGHRRADGRQVVAWMSDWDAADDLVGAGLLEREYRNGHGDPYAQTVVYLIPEAASPREPDTTDLAVRKIVLDGVRAAYS